ncbi:MAG: hypothetical protein AAF631_03710 [Pseudomonadota bacterium]
MNNTFAIVLAALLGALILFDLRMNDGAILVFWGRQGLRLVEWLAFWR